MRENSHQCSHCENKLCIRKVEIFRNLDHEDIVKISERIEHRSYHKGENIFSLGAALDFIVILNEGSAKAYNDTPEGREQILYVFSEGDFFGEQYLLNNQTATYTVEALEEVKVCMLSKQHFQELLLQHPGIGIKIIAELGVRMSRLEHAMEHMGVRNVDARIGSLLLDYGTRYGKKVPEGILIRLPLSREGIANYLGVARETVSRKFSQFEQEGILRSVTNKSIIIVNKPALCDVAGWTE